MYDLQHLLAEQYHPVKKNKISKQINPEKKSVRIKGGLYTMGYNGNEFCYDIELPEHKVYLNDYKIDAYPITNQQFMEFIKGNKRLDDFSSPLLAAFCATYKKLTGESLVKSRSQRREARRRRKHVVWEYKRGD